MKKGDIITRLRKRMQQAYARATVLPARVSCECSFLHYNPDTSLTPQRPNLLLVDDAVPAARFASCKRCCNRHLLFDIFSPLKPHGGLNGWFDICSKEIYEGYVFLQKLSRYVALSRRGALAVCVSSERDVVFVNYLAGLDRLI